MTLALSAKLRLLTFVSLTAVLIRHSYNLDLRFSDEAASATGGIVAYIEDFVSIHLTWVVIPLFFAISGYLFFRTLVPTWQGYLAKWRSRLRTLVVPYLLWSAWGIVVYASLQRLPLSRAYFVNNRLDGLPLGYVARRLVVDPLPYQLWFLQALIGCVALAPVVYWLVSRGRRWGLLPLAVLWLLDVNLGPYLRGEALMFFGLGCLAALGGLPSLRLPRRQTLTLLAVWVASIAAYTLVTTWVHEPALRIVFRLLMLPGLLAVWTTYDVLVHDVDREGRLWRVSAYGFFLYAAHQPLLMIVKKLLFRASGHSDVTDLVFYVLAPAVVVAVLLPVGSLLARRTPRFYALITGGR